MAECPEQVTRQYRELLGFYRGKMNRAVRALAKTYHLDEDDVESVIMEALLYVNGKWKKNKGSTFETLLWNKVNWDLKNMAKREIKHWVLHVEQEERHHPCSVCTSYLVCKAKFCEKLKRYNRDSKTEMEVTRQTAMREMFLQSFEKREINKAFEEIRARYPQYADIIDEMFLVTEAGTSDKKIRKTVVKHLSLKHHTKEGVVYKKLTRIKGLMQQALMFA